MRLHSLHERANPQGSPPPHVADVRGSYFTPADRRAADRLAGQYARVRADFGDRLAQDVARVEAGELGADAFHARMEGELAQAYERAFALGKQISAEDGAAALTDKDREFLKKETADELSYLKGFGKSLSADGGGDGGRMATDTRAGMYTKALDSVFLSGQMAGFPEQATMWWRLGGGEHCEDCLELADGGPYALADMPPPPGSGFTQCLTNCLCSVEIEVPEEAAPPGAEPTDEEPNGQPIQGVSPEAVPDEGDLGDDVEMGDDDAAGVEDSPEGDGTEPVSPDDLAAEEPEGESPETVEPEPEGAEPEAGLEPGDDATPESPPDAGASDGEPPTPPDDTTDAEPAYPSPDEVPSATVTDAADGSPVTPGAVAAALGAAAGAIGYYRQLAMLAPAADRQEWLDARDQSIGELEDLEDEHSVQAYPTWDTRSLRHALRGLDASDRIDSADQTFVGDHVAVVKGRTVWRGVVQALADPVVTVATRDGHTVDVILDEPPLLLFHAPYLPGADDSAEASDSTEASPEPAAEGLSFQHRPFLLPLYRTVSTPFIPARLQEDSMASKPTPAIPSIIGGGPVDVARSQCASCAHKDIDTLSCQAFPSGIPVQVFANLTDHRLPFPGDHGTRYQPLAASAPAPATNAAPPPEAPPLEESPAITEARAFPLAPITENGVEKKSVAAGILAAFEPAIEKAAPPWTPETLAAARGIIRMCTEMGGRESDEFMKELQLPQETVKAALGKLAAEGNLRMKDDDQAHGWTYSIGRVPFVEPEAPPPGDGALAPVTENGVERPQRQVLLEDK